MDEIINNDTLPFVKPQMADYTVKQNLFGDPKLATDIE